LIAIVLSGRSIRLKTQLGIDLSSGTVDIQGEPKKCPNMKITISQKCVNIFVPNFVRLFTRQLCKNELLCAVFT